MFTFKSLVVFFALATPFAWFNPSDPAKVSETNSFSVRKINEATLQKLKQRATVVMPFVTKNHFNSNICFFIDMSIPSSKKRFFVYDLAADSILKEGLVAHGSCDAGFQVNATFSNKPNSGCSAMGKYRIGGGYHGSFGLAYKLYGLDSSNNNAFNRSIVLHSYECVPDEETNLPLCNSRGCPMVSPGFLDQLKPIIDKSSKSILLWIFE